MSASEIYDFVSLATPDYNYVLVIKAQGTLTEDGGKNQVVHLADDDSEEIITLSSSSVFYVSWDWGTLSESNAGTIFDLYHDPTKANGMANSFKWLSHDGHTYVVRFDGKLPRTRQSARQWGFSGVVLKILGRIAD